MKIEDPKYRGLVQHMDRLTEFVDARRGEQGACAASESLGYLKGVIEALLWGVENA